MFRTTVKGIWAHKRRLLATGAAIVLGVAFLVGTLVLGDTLRTGFGDMFAEANAGTDAVVRGGELIGGDEEAERGPLDAAVVDAVRGVDGVAAAEPLVEGTAQIEDAEGDPMGGNGPPTIAVGWVPDDRLNPWDLAEGRAPERAGEVVIDRGSAEDGHLAVGDTATIRVPTPTEATVVGIATFGAADSMAGSTFVAFDTATAQQTLLGSTDQVSSVLVAGADGLSQADLVSRLQPVVPDGAEALTGVALTAEQKEQIEGDFLAFFEAFLLVFAGIALVVATFSIYNTFSILVAQRTRESALLRALGASRRQVLTSTVIEAASVGLVASALGLAAGLGVATGLVAFTESLGMDVGTGSLVVETGTVVTSLVVGLVVTLIAAAAPAVRASRVRPLAALRDVAVDRSATSRPRAVVGAVVAAGGVALTLVGSSGDGSLPLTGLGALATVVGVVVLGPVAARPVAGLLGRLVSMRHSVSGSLARRNAIRNPRRTAGTASALMVGVAVVTLFTVVAASMRSSVDDVVDEQFSGDLVMSVTSWSGSGLDPRLAQEVGELPEVATSVGIAEIPIRIAGADHFATASHIEPLAEVLRTDDVEGAVADVGLDQIAIEDDWAADHGLAVGDIVPVTFGDGVTEDLELGATYASGQLAGDVIVPRVTADLHSAQPSDFVIAVDLADGVSTADGEAAIQPLADRYGAPDVQDRQEYIDSVAGEIDQMLVVIYVLLALAIIIALMGIANTLSLSVHERTRELGLLRAVGQTRRQVRAMVRGESFVVALFGTTGGLALGTFLGWAMVQAIARAEGIGRFALPTGQLAVVVVLGAIVGVVAAVRPARRAARLDVLQAIATD